MTDLKKPSYPIAHKPTALRRPGSTRRPLDITALNEDVSDQVGKAFALDPFASNIPRLTDPSMAKALNELKAKIKSEPGYALSLLVQAGIATRTGKLAKRYGG